MKIHPDTRLQSKLFIQANIILQVDVGNRKAFVLIKDCVSRFGFIAEGVIEKRSESCIQLMSL